MSLLGEESKFKKIENLLKTEFSKSFLREDENFIAAAANDDNFPEEISEIVINHTIEELHRTPNNAFGGLTISPYVILGVYMNRMSNLKDNSTKLTFDAKSLGKIVFRDNILNHFELVKKMPLSNGPLSGVPYVSVDEYNDSEFLSTLEEKNAVLVGYVETCRGCNWNAEGPAVFVANKWVVFAIETNHEQDYVHRSAQHHNLFACTIATGCHFVEPRPKTMVTTRTFEDLLKIGQTLGCCKNKEIKGNIVIALGFGDYMLNCLLRQLGKQLLLNNKKIVYYVQNGLIEAEKLDAVLATQESWEAIFSTGRPSSEFTLNIGKIKEEWSFVLSFFGCVSYDPEENYITMLSIPTMPILGTSQNSLLVYQNFAVDGKLLKFGEQLYYELIPRVREFLGLTQHAETAVPNEPAPNPSL